MSSIIKDKKNNEENSEELNSFDEFVKSCTKNIAKP